MKKAAVPSILVAVVLLALGVTAEAQQLKKTARIGVLSPFSASVTAPWHRAFEQGLRERGWIEGQNIVIEYRYAEGKNNRLPDLAAELVRLEVDIIVTSGATETLPAKKVTTAIPIVMAAAGDPVGTGLVDSLARPGGNVTGLTNISPDLAGKRLELLKEVVPKLTRVALLWDPEGSQASTLAWKESQLPARELGLQLQSIEVRRPNDLDKALQEATKARAGALAVLTGTLFVANQKRIAELAAKSRLPSIFHLKEFVEFGGLIAYGPDRSDLYRRAATYVDKILKGAKPADLPVEQPMKFELVFNLKTAKQIGLAIPPNVLGRADRLIK
jgi:putative tryptophan/tyrosine transport system substrate-binding protein